MTTYLYNRGQDVEIYATSLSRYMAREIRAIRISKDREIADKILTVCINQWVASLCSRMLKESINILDREQMDKGGLDVLLSRLLDTESNLWFSEV